MRSDKVQLCDNLALLKSHDSKDIQLIMPNKTLGMLDDHRREKKCFQYCIAMYQTFL